MINIKAFNKKAFSIFLIIVMLIGIIPLALMRAYAANENVIAWSDNDGDGVIDDGETTYTTLAAAVSKNNAYLKMYRDYDASAEGDIAIGTLSRPIDITLDLNGKKITSSEASDLFEVQRGSITLKDSGTTGGITLTGSYDTCVVFLYNINSCSAIIEGGTYTATKPVQGTVVGVIKNGRFSSNPGGYVMDGHTSTYDEESGMWIVTEPEPEPGTGNYEVDNLTDLNSALRRGGTVKLLSDIEVSYTLQVSYDTELDLNGHKLTAPDNIASYATAILALEANLTVNDSSSDGGGGIDVSNVHTSAITSYADDTELIINDGTFTSGAGYAIKISDRCSVILNSGELDRIYCSADKVELSFGEDFDYTDILYFSIDPATAEGFDSEKYETVCEAQGTGKPNLYRIVEKVAPPVIVYTDKPVISFNESTRTVSASGNGTVTLYVDGTEVTNPYTFKQYNIGKSYAVTATAKEDGKELSESASLAADVGAANTPVCLIVGGTSSEYTSLALAINDAKAVSGAVVKLMTNIEAESTMAVDSGDFIIDLGGYEWSSDTTSLEISGGASVKITDTEGGGILSGYNTVKMYGNARLEISGGTVINLSGAGSTITTDRAGNATAVTLIISGGKVTANSLYSIGMNGASFVHSGGVIEKRISYACGTMDFSEHPSPDGIVIGVLRDSFAYSEDIFSAPDGFAFIDEGGEEQSTWELYDVFTLVCGHGTATLRYTDNADGTHSAVCACGEAVSTEAHVFGKSGLCVCGALCSHIGGSATCEALAICDICGTSYGALAGHTPGADDGNCTTAILCTVCEAVTTEAAAAHTDEDGNLICDTCYTYMGVSNPSEGGSGDGSPTEPEGTDPSDAPSDTDNANNGNTTDTPIEGAGDADGVTPSTAPGANDAPGADDTDGLGAVAILGIILGSIAAGGAGGLSLFWFVIKRKSWADLIALFKKT